MADCNKPNFGGSGGGTVDLTNYRKAGRSFLQFTVTNDITILDTVSYNLFNSTDGMFSSNGTLVTSGDTWDIQAIFDNDYLRPNDYLTTNSPYASIETSVFVRMPFDITGTQAREVEITLRRRTAASPTVPVAIPNRGVIKLANINIDALSIERIPTRSEGASDNYYVYGYAVFLENRTTRTITIPAASVIRVEIFNVYLSAINIAP